MKDRFGIEPRKRVLLTGVFGPFGVDDEYGRKENIMELFHNQVTKGQGLASFRFHHRSKFRFHYHFDGPGCISQFFCTRWRYLHPVFWRLWDDYRR